MLAPDPDLGHIWLADLLMRMVYSRLATSHIGLVDEPVADLSCIGRTAGCSAGCPGGCGQTLFAVCHLPAQLGGRSRHAVFAPPVSEKIPA
jgi:hypothetical protein